MVLTFSTNNTLIAITQSMDVTSTLIGPTMETTGGGGVTEPQSVLPIAVGGVVGSTPDYHSDLCILIIVLLVFKMKGKKKMR